MPLTGTVDVGQPFTLSGSFSDVGLNDGPWSVNVRWDLFQNRTSPRLESFSTSSQGAVTATHVFEEEGTYQVRLQLKDNFDGSRFTFTTVTVLPEGSTFVGNNVQVAPVDPTTGETPVTLKFTSVTAEGTTTVTSSDTGDPPPAGFMFGNPPIYYDLQTDASYTGSIDLCFTYDPSSFQNPGTLELLHGNGAGGWTPVTTSNDANAGLICGSVTSLSPFVLAEPSPSAQAYAWVGLKNSDDVGTKFDLRAEILKNGTVVGTGELDGVPGGSSGFNNAVSRLVSTIPQTTTYVGGDILAARLSVRISETVSGHRSGTARLWYNDGAANSRIETTANGQHMVLYLAYPSALTASVGPGPKRSIDVTVDKAVGGNPFKPFGTWSRTF
jgi:hypothetical protein